MEAWSLPYWDFKKNFNLLSYVYVEKLPCLNFGFRWTYFLVHFTMLGPPYNYLHVNTSFYVNPSFGGLSSQTIIDLMENHAWMHCFIYLGKAHTLNMWGNHMQQWCGMVNELNITFFHFIQNLLHYDIYVHKCSMCGGLQVWW